MRPWSHRVRVWLQLGIRDKTNVSRESGNGSVSRTRRVAKKNAMFVCQWVPGFIMFGRWNLPGVVGCKCGRTETR